MLIRTGRLPLYAGQPKPANSPKRARDHHTGNSNLSLYKTCQLTHNITLRQKLLNAIQKGTHTWSLIDKHRGNQQLINILLNLADSIELHTINLLQLHNLHQAQQKFKQSHELDIEQPHNIDPSSNLTKEVEAFKQFYKSPKLVLRKKNKANTSLRSQLLSVPITQPTSKQTSNLYQYLQDPDETEPITTMSTQAMEEELQSTQPNQPNQANAAKAKTPLDNTTNVTKTSITWVSDPTITQLSSTLLQNLKVEQEKLQEAGEDLNEATQYKEPSDNMELTERYKIRLSIKRARNSDSTIPTLKAFKSFTQALKNSDKTLAILPISISKQNLTALSTVGQLSSIDKNKLLSYFKPFYPNQKHSLSGYIYIASQLSAEDLLISTPLYEWMETNRYTVKPCLSSEDEMVRIGALCFGSEYIYRDDLTQAIQQHPSWQFPQFETPPIIQLSRGEFRGPKKSIKMLFVQTERTKQHEVGKFFSQLYDGTSKQYPNGIMLLFIPLYDHIHHEPAYRQKVIYNHERYLGEEEALCIHGLQDFNNTVQLKSGQQVTIRLLLRSLPATLGMSRPQLFQMVETDSTKDVVIVTYQKKDKEYVNERKMNLETDIITQLAPGETPKVFISEMEGIWFTTVIKNKYGQIIAAPQTSKTNLDYVQHTNTILSSPPKKRPFHSGRSGNLQQPAQQQPQQQPVTYSAATSTTSHQHIQQHYHNGTPSTPGTNHTTQSLPTQTHELTDEINQRFQIIEDELHEQQKRNADQAQWNDEILYRMNYLEDTTTSTDTKVEAILNKLDSWDIPTKRRGVTNNEERSAPHPPLHQHSGAQQP